MFNFKKRQSFTKPFEAEIIDDFLSEKEFEEILQIYKKSEFKELKSDLFRFLQTNELCKDNKLSNFTEKLDSLFLPKLKNCIKMNLFYTIFGSFYRKDDFLLCHDDCIDNREYAFTFYLEDCSSGKLILFENDCITEFKRIEIKKNRLVLFKVGKFSYHEVEACQTGGRMAITGWINDKTTNHLKHNIDFDDKIKFIENISFIEIPIKICSSYALMDLGNFEITEGKRFNSGPLIDRRAIKIIPESPFAPKIEGYNLIHFEYLKIPKNGYILCNDVINRIHLKKEIFDIFIFKNDCKNFINLVNKNGEIEGVLDAVSNNMLYGKRKNLIFISNPENEVKFIHLIYQKN